MACAAWRAPHPTQSAAPYPHRPTAAFEASQRPARNREMLHRRSKASAAGGERRDKETRAAASTLLRRSRAVTHPVSTCCTAARLLGLKAADVSWWMCDKLLQRRWKEQRSGCGGAEGSSSVSESASVAALLAQPANPLAHAAHSPSSPLRGVCSCCGRAVALSEPRCDEPLTPTKFLAPTMKRNRKANR